MERAEKITIKEVDSETVEKDDSFPDGLAFYINLSGNPHSVWLEIFVSEYEQAWYNLKREVAVFGDRIRVVTAPGEEQGHIDFVKGLVSGTNQKVDLYNAEVERTLRAQDRKESVDANKVREAKERLKKVRI